MAKEEVMPSVQDEYKAQVDELIKIELENMRIIAGIKKKKLKRKKAKKAKKKRPLKLPGVKALKGMLPKEILV